MTLSLRLRIGLVLVGAGLAMAGAAVQPSDAASLSVESQPDGSATVVEVAGSIQLVVFHGSPPRPTHIWPATAPMPVGRRGRWP